MGQIDEKRTEPTKPQVVGVAKDNIDDLISTTQLGVWEVLTLKGTPLRLRQLRDEFVTGSVQFYELWCEMYRLSPGMLILFTLSKTWSGIEAAVLMHLSSRLLHIIEIGLIRGEVDAHAISMAIVARLSCVVLVAILQWWSEILLSNFQAQVIHHFQVILMRGHYLDLIY
ncbi:hypothetical protein BDZ94DRAFT_83031 [Collybia nuda]|uniref:Uncharacterized protein n=1 Tax=Collybia nuda TaxID=64659 RepID=A0A9P6CAL5_9AGAR|nr:hypothetical protein BDZ94DRAFT_83031 [Collybia nuda]